MFEILGAIILLWLAGLFIREMCFAHPGDENAQITDTQDEFKKRAGWLYAFPLICAIVFIVKPDYGLEK